LGKVVFSLGRKVLIEASGWHYKHWLVLFYPGKTTRQRDACALCAAFWYGLAQQQLLSPAPSAFNNGRKTAADNFAFSE
jgi:hypothetical protein